MPFYTLAKSILILARSLQRTLEDFSNEEYIDRGVELSLSGSD